MGRKITIINSKTQSQSVISNSTATTLSELKAELRSAGVDYEGMSFYEGHLRAELKDDASILPTNIPYKGETVNDLVFMLTASEKKIKSGGMTRTEVFAYIKQHNLQDNVKAHFGRNFTQVGTVELNTFIANHCALVSKKPAASCTAEEVEVPNPPVAAVLSEEDKRTLLMAVNAIITIAEHFGVAVNAVAPTAPVEDKISAAEINDMFSFLH